MSHLSALHCIFAGSYIYAVVELTDRRQRVLGA